MIRKAVGISGLLLVVLCGLQAAAAPPNVSYEQHLTTLVEQLQSGTADKEAFAPEMWKTIVQQTGGTGRYPQLEKLGAVSSIYILKQSEGAELTSRDAVVTHKAGLSTWHLRISKATDRIEWLSFYRSSNSLPQPGSIPPAPSTPTTPRTATPDPRPSASPPSASPPSSSPPSPAPSPSTSVSEACRKFPNLC